MAKIRWQTHPRNSTEDLALLSPFSIVWDDTQPWVHLLAWSLFTIWLHWHMVFYPSKKAKAHCVYLVDRFKATHETSSMVLVTHRPSISKKVMIRGGSKEEKVGEVLSHYWSYVMGLIMSRKHFQDFRDLCNFRKHRYRGICQGITK